MNGRRERTRADSPSSTIGRPDRDASVQTLTRSVLQAQRSSGNRSVARALLARRKPAAEPVTAAGELTAAARGLVADWVTLGQPLARAKRLGDAANTVMRAREVTPVDLSFAAPPRAGPIESVDGFFASETWTLHVREAFFSSETAPDEAALLVAITTIAHEARHADQWFSMARYAAGREDKPTVPAMAAELHIPERVARHARSRPLREGEHGYAQAAEFYEEVYGAGSEQRAKVLDSLMSAQVALVIAKANLDKATDDESRKRLTDAFNAASAEYARWYRLYMRLPTELDAERVAKIVGDALKRS